MDNHYRDQHIMRHLVVGNTEAKEKGESSLLKGKDVPKGRKKLEPSMKEK